MCYIMERLKNQNDRDHMLFYFARHALYCIYDNNQMNIKFSKPNSNPAPQVRVPPELVHSPHLLSKISNHRKNTLPPLHESNQSDRK